MEQHAFIMEATAGAILLIVGARLALLSRQTREVPERLISLAFLLWALGYALYDIPYVFTEGDESVAPFFAYTSILAFNVGNVVLAVFIKRVFRKEERWADWLVVAIAICFAVGLAGSAWVGDWEQYDPVGNPGYWPQTVGDYAVPAWMGFEGIAHYLKMRRRLEIGLCTPLACHHFLLWGLAGSLWVSLELVIVLQDFVYLSAGDWSVALAIANGLLELVPIGMIWLIFFAPAGYRRWIDGAAPA
jgi:hypothetical protein